MYRSRSVSIALIGLFMWLTACTTYTQVEPGDVADYEHVRVTLTDGEKRDLYRPVIDADSIRFTKTQYYPDPTYVIPLDRVSKLESVHADAGKTTGLVLGVIVGAAAIVFVGFALACSGEGKCGGF